MWVRPGATPAEASADERRCRTEAAAVVDDAMFYRASMPWEWGPPGGRYPGWPAGYRGGYGGWWPDPSAELAAEQSVYDRCMRAKGYDLVRVDRKPGQPR